MPDNFSKNDIMDTAVMCYCKIYTSRIFYHKGIIIPLVQNLQILIEQIQFLFDM